MKVKNVNVSSRRTREAIKNAFIDLIDEKKEIQYITVTELVNKAGITRSSFYTHYSNISDIVKDMEEELISDFFNSAKEVYSLDGVNNYIDTLIEFIKEEEIKFRKLVSSMDSIIFLDRIRTETIFILDSLLNNPERSLKVDKLDIEFFVDGTIYQLVKYLRLKDFYSLDKIKESIKLWFKKIILEK